MKKFVLLVMILLIPSCFALSIEKKETYMLGETMIAKIIGVTGPIPASNVELKRNNVQVPFEYTIEKIGGDYYLYAVLPTNANNYTLIIRDVQTTVQGQPTTQTLEEQIIVEGNFSSYAIKAQTVVTESTFKFIIILYDDASIQIPTNIPSKENLVLVPGENELSFSAEYVPAGFSLINIGSYEVPIYSLKASSNAGNFNTNPLSKGIFFNPPFIRSTLLAKQKSTLPIRFINNYDYEIKNLKLDYDKTLFVLSPDSIKKIGPSETIEFNLTIKERQDALNGIIKITGDNVSIELPIEIDYTENSSQVSVPYLGKNTSASKGYFCAELGGKSCLSSQTCSSTVSTLDNPSCCITECTESKGSYSWIGYLLGAVLLIALVIVGARYMKTRKQGNPMEKRFVSAEKSLKP